MPHETGREIKDFLGKVDLVKVHVPDRFRGTLDATQSMEVSKALEDAVAVGSSRSDDSEARESVGGGDDYISARIDTHTDSESEDDTDKEVEQGPHDSESEDDGVAPRTSKGKRTDKEVEQGPQDSESEDDGVAPKTMKGKRTDNEVEQGPQEPQPVPDPQSEPQESLPEWEDWSVEGKGEVDKATILKTLASAVFNALFFIVGFWRGRVGKRGAQPQSPQDVRGYKREVSDTSEWRVVVVLVWILCCLLNQEELPERNRTLVA